MFYDYRQNNSGGEWLGEYIRFIVEADSYQEADAIVQNHGVYFDGCMTGQDCDCCGDRWSSAVYEEGHEVPSVYSTPIEEYDFKYDYNMKTLVIYKNGTTKEWQ